MFAQKSMPKKALTMKLLSAVFLFVLPLALGGCGDPTIDASSPEKLHTSLEETMKSLPEIQQEQFRQDVIVLARGASPDQHLSIADYITGRDNPKEAKPIILRHFYNALHGKTAQQVIAEAVNMRVVQEKKLQEEKAKQGEREAERKKLLQEINAIKEQQRQATRNEIQLRSIKVWRTSFSYDERYAADGETLIRKPVIQVTVYNGTDHTFHKIHFIGSLTDPDSKRPVHKEPFNYTIAKGLRPGEEEKWTIYPDASSGWNHVTIPPNATFLVEVQRVDDVKGEEILPGLIFSNEDKEKLESLREKYQNMLGTI